MFLLARALRANALRAAAGAAVAGATSLALAEAAKDKRFYEIEGDDALLAFKPAVPYPGWDSNWDDLKLTSRQVAKELGHEWSSKFDYAANIRKLFAEHTDVPETEVDVLVAQSDDLPKLYRQSYAKHAWGGASGATSCWCATGSTTSSARCRRRSRRRLGRRPPTSTKCSRRTRGSESTPARCSPPSAASRRRRRASSSRGCSRRRSIPSARATCASTRRR